VADEVVDLPQEVDQEVVLVQEAAESEGIGQRVVVSVAEEEVHINTNLTSVDSRLRLNHIIDNCRINLILIYLPPQFVSPDQWRLKFMIHKYTVPILLPHY
jgi:hypothetical protein